jgi:hypothetical protein
MLVLDPNILIRAILGRRSSENMLRAGLYARVSTNDLRYGPTRQELEHLGVGFVSLPS